MSYTTDFKSFENGMRKYGKEALAQSKQILRHCASSYAKKASLYVPPGDGKGKKLGASTIPKYMYYRSVKYLPLEVKDSKNTKRAEDLEALRSGKLFKVKSKKRNKTVVWYFKTLRSAKKYMRIRNRGLFKVSFGSALERIGEIIPAMLRSMMGKSPNLGSLKALNKINETSTDKDSKIEVKNMAYGNESFASIAIREGDKAAYKTLKSELTKFAKERREI